MNNRQVICPANELPTDGLHLLEEVMEELSENLQKYVQQPNPNQYRVDKMNKLRAKLYKVYNSISFLKYYDVWADIERIMDSIEKEDEVLSGHAILIRTRKKGQGFSIIDKYQYI